MGQRVRRIADALPLEAALASELDGREPTRGPRYNAHRVLAVSFYDVVLWVHITAVMAAFGALFAYPLFLAHNARSPIERRAGLHRLQIVFSKRVTAPMIGLILLAGAYLATDRELWDEPWVIISLALFLVIAGLGATVLRDSEEQLAAASEAGDQARYAGVLARAQRSTLVTVGLVVLTIYVMTAKPFA